MKKIISGIFATMLACSAFAADNQIPKYLQYSLSINEIASGANGSVTPVQGMAREMLPFIATKFDAASYVSGCAKTGLSTKEERTGFSVKLTGATETPAQSMVQVNIQLNYSKLLGVEKKMAGDCVAENPNIGSFTLDTTISAKKGEKVLVTETYLQDNKSKETVGQKYQIWLTVM